MGTEVIPTGSQPPPKPGAEKVAPFLLDALASLTLECSQKRAIWATLRDRLDTRVEAGRQKYGTMLMTFNGRNALQDAWEESADKLFYLYQAWLEGIKEVEPLLTAEADSLFELTWLIEELTAEKIAESVREGAAEAFVAGVGQVIEARCIEGTAGAVGIGANGG